MNARLPLLFATDEIERLHGIAYAAAIQTGAKGEALDQVTSDVFRALAGQANADLIGAAKRPALRLIEG